MKHAWMIVAACYWLTACSGTRPAAAPAAEVKQDTGVVSMEPVAQKNLGLEISPVQLSQLTEYLQVTGTVQPVNSRVSQVRSLARGRVLEVLARTGDRVRQGQELARIDNLEAGELTAQLASARAELQRLKVLLAAQLRQVERNRKLSEIGAAPQKDFEQSLAEQQALEQSVRAQEGVLSGLEARLTRFGRSGGDPNSPLITAIAAPFAGIVTRSVAAPGEVIDSGTGLFTVADISQVWVQAEVYEKDLGRIRVGQPAVIHVDTYPDEPFGGRVTYIADALDPQTRTAKVRCEVPNGGLRLKLDMFATVQLPTTFSRRALAVPVGAIQQIDGKTIVFVHRAPTQFEAREIKPGKTVNGRVEILAGLRDGEPVVVTGSYRLKSILTGKDLGEE